MFLLGRSLKNRGSTGLQASLLALLFRIQIKPFCRRTLTFQLTERLGCWWLVATTISEVVLWYRLCDVWSNKLLKDPAIWQGLFRF